jgi:hypothetical protein
MPAGSVEEMIAVVEHRSGAETRRVAQTPVFVCHYERRKRRNRAVLSLWTLKHAASRWVNNGVYGMAKDVEMRIWRHSSKGQVA